MSDYTNDRDVAALKALADERGCDLIVADDNVLLLDLDGGDDRLELFWSQVDLLYRNGAWPGDTSAPGEWDVEIWRSRSGENWHGLVHLRAPLPLMERIALQTFLGSDPVREALAYVRRDGENPIVLFKPRYAE